MTLHLLYMQEDEEFRSGPQVTPEISVGLFLYEYQNRYQVDSLILRANVHSIDII